MVFSIDSRSRTPIYEQLKQNILSQIAAGMLKADEQLPSVRSLARELGVNPNTVQKAYQELDAQGIIYQAAGRGSFVSGGDEGKRAIEREQLEKLEHQMWEARRVGVQKASVLSITERIFGEEMVK